MATRNDLRLESFMEAAPDAMLVVNLDGEIQLVNSRGERTLGYARSELLGRPVEELLPRGLRVRHIEQRRAYCSEPQQRAMGAGLGLRALRRDGTELPIDISLSPFEIDGETLIAAAIRDVTDQTAAKARLAGQNRILKTIATRAPLREVLIDLVLLIESQSEGMLGSVLTLDDDGIHVRTAAAPSLPDAYSDAIDGASIGPATGSCGTAMYERRMVITSEIQTDPLWQDYEALATAYDLRACWSTPILSADGPVLGSFAMYYRTPRSPNADELELIEMASSIAGIAIEHARAEHALRQSSQRLTQVLSDNAAVVYSLHTVHGSLKPQWISDNVERVLGYPAHEALDPEWWADNVHPEDRSAAIAARRHLVAGERHSRYRFRRKDGSYAWIQDEQRVVRSREDDEQWEVVCTWTDITERKRSEDALRVSEARYRTLVEEAPEAIVILDVESGRFVEANRNAEELYGLPLDELLQTGPIDHSPEVQPNGQRSRDLAAAKIREAVDGGTPTFEWTHRRANGEAIPCEIRLVRFPADDRVLIRGSVTDITEHRRAERERRAYLWFLESMDRVHRAIQGSRDLDALMGSVLGEVLDVFGCDRAWLAYPCDPDAPTWRIAMERTVAEFPGAYALGRELPVDDDVAALMRSALRASEPLQLAAQHSQGNAILSQFGIRSQLATALLPAIDRPFLFGLHQCSEARAWNRREVRLFQLIGRRLTDALTSAITLRVLRESERKLEEAQRIAHVGYWDRDFENDDLTLSQEACRIFGLPSGNEPIEFSGLTPLIHPEDRHAFLDTFASARFSGPKYDVEFRVVRSDGEIRFVHNQGDLTCTSSGEPRRMFGTVQDITDRKLAQRALVESHSLLEAVVEGIPDALWIRDLHDRYLLVNSAGARLIGRPVAEIIGKSSHDLFSDAEAEDHATRNRRAIAGGEQHTVEETIVRSGRTRSYLTTEDVYRDALGNVRGVIGVSRDITELKQLEAQFLHAQKMEAVGRLAGGVAHDYNNLLTVVIGNSEMVLKLLEDRDPKCDLLLDVLKAGEHAAELTRQLLAFSRKQVLEPRVCNLNNRIAGLQKLLRRLVGEEHRLQIEPSIDLGCVKVDPGQFEQCVINLAINARDAMSSAGCLRIATANRNIDDAQARQLADIELGPYVCLSVSDTGDGMDDTTKSQIFDPFFTTKGISRGTGLGLAMVYGFVKQSGGHILVESEVGRGSTFQVLLPRCDADEPLPAKPSPSPGPTTGSECVLLVEDEPAVRAMSSRALVANGYHVIEAANGPAALARVREDDSAIDLLVSDVVMPGMDGRELANAIRKLRPNIKVLLVSGYPNAIPIHANEDVSSDADAADGNTEYEFMAKPFTPTRLANRIRQILDA